MFCLGCGTELKGAAPKAAPKPAARPVEADAPAATGATSAGALAASSAVARGSAAPPSYGGAAASAPQAPVPQPENVACPRCATMVPKTFRFCGSCGFDMTTIAAAPVPSSAPAQELPAGPARLVLIRPDGSEGDVVPIGDDFVVGREAGGPFAGDSYLSPQHARFRRGPSSYAVEDLGSLNGVYLRLERDVPVTLVDGSVFRIGQEIIRFDAIRPPTPGPNGEEVMGSPNPGYLGRISLVIGRDTYGNAYPVPPDGMHLGRERGDIIFPDDGYVSGLHCRIHLADGAVQLTDVGSSNGTFIRLTRETQVPMGGLLLLGQQLFRLEL